MPVAKRPGEWYTPYFAPMTILIAALVLLVSIQIGWYAGNYFIARDKAPSLTAPVNPSAPHATKTAGHNQSARAKLHASKTSHS